MTQLSDKIYDLRKQGMTYKQIQDELGCSKGTIAYHLGEGQKSKALRRNNEYYMRLREDVRKHKESIGCIDCGGKYPYFVLQFDHIGDDKLHGISNMTSAHYSRKRVFEEIAKCEVVCVNCHAIRTFLRTISSEWSNDMTTGSGPVNRGLTPCSEA